VVVIAINVVLTFVVLGEATKDVDDCAEFKTQIEEPAKAAKQRLATGAASVKLAMSTVTKAVQAQDRNMARQISGKAAKLDDEAAPSEDNVDQVNSISAAGDYISTVVFNGDGSFGLGTEWQDWWKGGKPILLSVPGVVEELAKLDVVGASRRFLEAEAKNKPTASAKLRTLAASAPVCSLLANQSKLRDIELFAQLRLTGEKMNWAKEFFCPQFTLVKKGYTSVPARALELFVGTALATTLG